MLVANFFITVSRPYLKMILLLLEVLPMLLADVLDALLEDPLGLFDVARLLEHPRPVDVELGPSGADSAFEHELENLDGVVGGVGVLGPHVHEAPVLGVPVLHICYVFVTDIYTRFRNPDTWPWNAFLGENSI